MRTSRGFLVLAMTFAACSGGGDTSVLPPTSVLTSVVISAPAQSLVAGQTLQLSASPKDQNGGVIAATVSWTTSSASVAAVNGSGLVSALAAGTVTVTATASAGGKSVSASTLITITAAPPVPVLTSVSISAPSTSLLVGATVQLTAAPKDQNGNAIAAAVTWSSSAAAIASVNASTGLITAVSVGTTTITSSALAGGVTVTSTVLLTVTAPPITPVLTSVTVTPATQSIVTGGSATLIASPKDENGTPMAATVTWSSSATSVATVNATGVVLGVSAGTATITATATAGGVTKTGTSVITVTTPPPVLSSVLITGSSTVAVGATITLTGSPRDQANAPIAASVTWNSSALGIATVNASTGVVTGVSAGSATITATATAGSTTVQNAITITVTSPPPMNAAVTATTSNTFAPLSVDIQVGGMVAFTFDKTHNVTFGGGSAPANIGNTSSGTVSRTFSAAGSFDYVCTLHAGMSGVVVVR